MIIEQICQTLKEVIHVEFMLGHAECSYEAGVWCDIQDA